VLSPTCTCTSPPPSPPPPSPPPPRATCLPNPLPTTPLEPVFARDVNWFTDSMRFELWRHPCQDGVGSFPLLRVTPLTVGPFLCSSVFSVQQGGRPFGNIRLALEPGSSLSSFCGDLVASATFALASWAHEPPFYDPDEVFTVVFDGGDNTATLEVPAATAPPPPPPPGPPSVTVVIKGCTTCRVGDFAKIDLSIINPGAAQTVEMKVFSRFPDGSTIFNFIDRHHEQLLPGNTSFEFVIPGLTLPSGLPFGSYTIEAALLEPETGVTISRHSVPAQLVP